MQNSIWGVLLSVLPIFLIIGVATLLQNQGKVNDEGARKIIHIGVSNWWIMAMILFTNPWWASVAPLTFIILNYISYRKNLFAAMERNGNGNLGTVYFPISLLVLSLLTFSSLLPVSQPQFIGAVGILVMGYGDGFAAVIGKKYGKHRWKSGKSVEGSLTMFIASFVVTLTLAVVSTVTPSLVIAGLLAFGVAAVATLLEAYTPYGFDNLTVPLGSSFVYFILLMVI